MINRPATNEEIFNTFNTRRIQFKHFVREIYNPRAKNGVSQRQYASSKLTNVDGVPHVKYQGELQAVQASYYTLDNGNSFVANLRLDIP